MAHEFIQGERIGCGEVPPHGRHQFQFSVLLRCASVCALYALGDCTGARTAASSSVRLGDNGMRLALLRGEAEPSSMKGARYTIYISGPDTTRVLGAEDFGFPETWSREYRIPDAGELHVRVLVQNDAPFLRGEGKVTIGLRPDLYLWISISAESPSTDSRVYRCRGCTGRAMFPIYGRDTLIDSLMIGWQEVTRSRPPPPTE
jgi:hypothetical protein